MEFPVYPKADLRNARDVKGWPHPSTAPGRYEFDSEWDYAVLVNENYNASVEAYAAANGVSTQVAKTILDEQVGDAKRLEASLVRSVWHDENEEE